jgi:hypothetical protein
MEASDMGEVELIAYLLDHAFEGGEFHGLIGNLRAVGRGDVGDATAGLRPDHW